MQQGVLLLAPRLDRSKYDAAVWSLHAGKKDRELAADFEKLGVPVAFTPMDGYHDRRGILALARRLRQEGVELLNTRSFLPNILGRFAAAIAGTPIVVANYHHIYEHRWNRKYIACERALRGGTASFVCVSNAVRDYLTPLLGLPAGRVRVLYNGLNLSEYQIDSPKENLRERIGLRPKVPIVAYVGRLTAIKDVPTLLRSAPIVLKSHPDAEFVIVGEGEERKALEAFVKELGVERSVSFLGSRRDVPEILNAVDALVLPSLAEGFPRILLEAFASRTPVITTPASGVSEIVRDQLNGLIVPFGDSERIAAAICRTLSEKDETRRRCAHAFADVQRFTIESWVRETEGIFDAEIEREEYGRIEAFRAGLGRRKVPFESSLRYFELKFYMFAARLFAGRAPTINPD